MYTYTLCQNQTAESYDEAMAVSCLQGLINRSAPRLYVLSTQDPHPQHWLDILSAKGRWMHDRAQEHLSSLEALLELAGDTLNGMVIWDPEVPATINAATVIAGVESAVVLSPEYALRYADRWGLPVLADLRGKFTGAETGSAKNDAYRWAIREYLAKGACSSRLFCLFEDSFYARDKGDTSYVVTRDWAVSNRAFVFDLSPWDDEKPADDPDQPLGTDLATYRVMLEEMLRQSGGKTMTEMTGFFPFAKYSNVPGHQSKHDPVPTEWETVYLISPYNCYQNTVSSDCYNQSFHSQAAPVKLRQRGSMHSLPTLENKAYICILMADYDSTTPLYQFLPKHWADAERGRIPLAWGINPNLLETYPDIIAYFYSTATENDHFTSDASAAGYMNPNRVRKEFLPLFVEHNRRFFERADMTMAPMVLDWNLPTPEVKDAFSQFAPDGMAAIITDHHAAPGSSDKMFVEPHVWNGMPVTNLINDAFHFRSPESTASAMSKHVMTKKTGEPGFFLFRIVWASPADIVRSIAVLKDTNPEQQIVVVDPYSFFALLKTHLCGML